VYNLMTAAAAAGINRSTVLRAIKAGRISAQ
jgi:predicted site-specific integrase-resolvase